MTTPTARRLQVAALLLLIAAVPLVAGCSGPAERPPANFGPPRAQENAFPPADPADRRAIRRVLRRQERAWNAGDLDAFMRGYARTDTLRFASGGGVRTGWQTTLRRYRESYPDREAMGTLSFSDLEIDLLSGRHALVFGRWRLTREATGDAGGLFTLLFEKTSTEDGRVWRIVADHTSSGGPS